MVKMVKWSCRDKGLGVGLEKVRCGQSMANFPLTGGALFISLI